MYARNSSIKDQPLDASFRELFPGNVYIPYLGKPAGKVVHVRPSVYERGRGTVTAFNWDKSSMVLPVAGWASFDNSPSSRVGPTEPSSSRLQWIGSGRGE